MTNPFETPEAARHYMEMDKSHHFKWHSIFPTTIGLLGGAKGIEGKDFLDVGCGYGAFSEMLVDNGAYSVAGVDSSAEMIKLARERAARTHPGKIAYVEQAGEQMLHMGNFDAVTAILFFNFFDNLGAIRNVCDNVYKNLKPNGRFIAFQNNFQDSGFDFDGKTIGNVTYRKVGQNPEGAEIWNLMRQGERDSQSWDFYSWKKRHYEHVLSGAGFGGIRWHNPIISQQGMDTLPKQWILDYINGGLFKAFEATK